MGVLLLTETIGESGPSSNAETGESKSSAERKDSVIGDSEG
jgi:hypothetical protein